MVISLFLINRITMNNITFLGLQGSLHVIHDIGHVLNGSALFFNIVHTLIACVPNKENQNQKKSKAYHYMPYFCVFIHLSHPCLQLLRLYTFSIRN